MYEHLELPDDVLANRAQELLAIIDIPRSHERDEQLQHELACIAFEEWVRWNESKNGK